MRWSRAAGDLTLLTLTQRYNPAVRPFQRFLPALVLAAAFLAALGWSWDRWPDVLIDSGRELYIPWRITQGQVLYRDLASPYGPWSSYFNALVFEVLGVSIRSLEIANGLIAALVVGMLYWLLRQFTGRLPATVGGLTFIFLSAFNRSTPIADYNWVFPYSHELTHGVALSLASLCALVIAARGRRGLWSFAAGLALGATFLTKPEVFTATVIAHVAVLAWTMPGRGDRKRWCRGLAAWLLGSILPVAAAAAALGATGAAGAWRYVPSQLYADHTFYQHMVGTDDLARNVTVLLVWAAVYLVVFGVPAWTGRCWPRQAKKTAVAMGIMVFMAFVLGGLGWQWSFLTDLATPLPLALAAWIVGLVFAGPSRREPATAAALGLAVLSLALLAKIALRVQPFHYGFALAAPGMALAVATLLGWLPERLERAGGSGLPLRATAAIAWLGVVGVYTLSSLTYYAHDTVPVGRAGDVFFTSPDRGPSFNAILEELALRAHPGQTLVVMPEGVMVNYLLRMPNPTPYNTFNPSELSMYGQGNILGALQAHPPDFIVLADKDTSDWGYPSFGADYGQPIFQWVIENYEPVGRAGARPLAGEGFGMELFKRRTSPRVLEPQTAPTPKIESHGS